MLKVLVVEDEEIIRKGIVLTVDWASLDCTVVAEAANGVEGIAAAKKYAPDIIITDIKMPQMDGIEMVQTLRNIDNNASVIILTAYDTFSYVQSALRLGAVDYLLKPFHDGELENVILRIQERLNLRTRPKQQKRNIQSRYVLEAMDYISSHYAEPDISVSSISRALNISEGHLSHLFKKETDDTILGYLTKYRIHLAMEKLKDHHIRIYEVAESIGYKDIAYFSSTFKKFTGMSPSEYQNSV